MSKYQRELNQTEPDKYSNMSKEDYYQELPTPSQLSVAKERPPSSRTNHELCNLPSNFYIPDEESKTTNLN